MLKSKRFETIREYPGTSILAASWVVVYLVMVLAQWQGWTPSPEKSADAGPLGIGAISQQTGQMFGAWNSAEILCGQVWRTILATFVHFGLIHIALNMFGMIQLGQLIEEWYGPKLLIAIVILIGFLGNGMASLARPLIGSNNPAVLMITSGGGSTVVFGLIGLIAVVGLRSRSRMGKYLYNQMIGLLVFNLMIGLTIPQIDNYAHAGGALAGALIGRLHYTMIAWHENRPGRCRAVLGLCLIVIMACVYGQVWVARVQSKIEHYNPQVKQLETLRISIGETQARFITRSALGLEAVQVINTKGRFRLPWDRTLFLKVSDKMVRDNQKALVAAIEKTDRLVQETGSESLMQGWVPLRTELRMAIPRPPLNSEIRPFQIKIGTMIQLLAEEAKSIENHQVDLAKKLVLIRTPWPNVIWTELGPAMKNGPVGRPVNLP